MAIFKRGKFYWYKFMWDGELIRESTRQTNDKVARNMESAHRTSLAQGLVGIREKKAASILSEFLTKEFVPYVEAKHAAKPGTVEYYSDGANMLSNSDMKSLHIDQVSDQHAQAFAAQHPKWSASRVNCGLRTLRRALNLAFQWGKLDRPAKITLAKGERQRDRVLTDAEVTAYLTACPQPWRDVATMIRGEGMRPGEAFVLRWENVHLNGSGGYIQITEGKTKQARRLLPMVPDVYTALRTRWEAAGRPAEGWLFPSGSREGHFNKDSAKDQHAVALRESKVKRFEPYVLRHTGLTRLAEAGCDAFTLARIAGHSSITITQRYIHPQADAIQRAFIALNSLPKATEDQDTEQGRVGTKLGTAENAVPVEVLQVVGAKGGTRTPTGFPARS